MKNEVPQISHAELEVLKVIWSSKEPVRASEIIKALESLKAWKPKTIKTLLRRLSDKEVIGYEIHGNAYIYHANINEQDYLDQENDNFLARLYNGSLNHLVLSFVKSNKLQPQQISELIEILEKGQE